MKRWPAAYKALEKELQLRIEAATNEQHLQRAEIRAKLPVVWDALDEFAPAELTEMLTGEKLDQTGSGSTFFEEVYEAIDTQKTLSFNWTELVDLHSQTVARRRGEPLSSSWFKAAKQAVARVLPVNESPSAITKENIRYLIEQLRLEGLSDKTISTQLGVLQALVQTGIEEDKLSLPANPFRSVRFSANTKEQDRYLPFDLKTQLPILLTQADHSWIFELLCTTGMRIGELLNRRPQDIDGRMIVIGRTETWKPKTKSSYRRVPIPEHLLENLEGFLPVSSPGAWEQRLRPQVRGLFQNKQLVIHSCRHTFKTLSRKVGMPSDISDEIDGHKKKDVSAISDHYGDYPDETLIKWIDTVSSEISSLLVRV